MFDIGSLLGLLNIHDAALVFVGLIIGWHVPQPDWAKPVSDAVYDFLMKVKNMITGFSFTGTLSSTLGSVMSFFKKKK